MTINNIEEIRKHLTFTSDFDRYVVHIIKRAKDDRGVEYGSNETNRLIKTFYITSLEYFDKKIPVIKDLCESNAARAYLLPQVRNNEDCLKELLKVVVDNIDNPTIKPDHLIRSAYSGMHKSRDKKWILDLDNDNMTEYRTITRFLSSQIKEIQWTAERVLMFVHEQLQLCGRTDADAWMVPTRHGHCIVTSPFDLDKAYKKCNMLYQGATKQYVGDEAIGPGEYKKTYKNNNGWLIKDGMVLMYFADSQKCPLCK